MVKLPTTAPEAYLEDMVKLPTIAPEAYLEDMVKLPTTAPEHTLKTWSNSQPQLLKHMPATKKGISVSRKYLAGILQLLGTKSWNNSSTFHPKTQTLSLVMPNKNSSLHNEAYLSRDERHSSLGQRDWLY